jgi:hypothetical protein
LRDERPFAIHKTPAITGGEIAKRTKYQLIASVKYLVNFWLRKVHRRVELVSKKPDGS